MRGFAARLGRNAADGFRDEHGFTTFGSVLALLIALSLLFTAAQVQRISSASAEVQDVADAAALAAQNEVAEFMTVVRVCDALVLSMSLTGIVATGLGIAALCTPATAFASEPLLSAGKSIIEARDAFAEKASAGLDRLQALIPFFSAANAAAVAQANGSSRGRPYLALALPCPSSGEPIGIDPLEGAGDLADDAQDQAGDIQEAASRAEEAAEKAQRIKERAFLRDCGDAPGYCMQERAATLAGLSGRDNPLYRSVDSWSFSVALDRAKAYYAAREAQEAPEGPSIEAQVQSQLRKRFYEFANEELASAYVHEGEGSFEAFFPRFPRSTDEMRSTRLYTDAVYPLSRGEDGPLLHAWRGCPAASGAGELGSLAQMEQEGYGTCPVCGFTAASLGKVAAASTSIENGFEYHYDAVAAAAAEYQEAIRKLEPAAKEVKDKAGGLLERCAELLGAAGGSRIEASPPGSAGSIVLVASASDVPAAAAFPNAFSGSSGTLGMRAAVSAASLLGDEADDQGDAISSLLDGFGDRVASGPAGIVLDCWSGLLRAYADGQGAVDDALEGAVSSLPLASASGLGTWAADAFEGAVSALGLQPASLDALKPVLVNSAHVAAKDDAPFSARLLSLKRAAVENPSMSTDALSSIVGSAEGVLVDGIDSASKEMEIASIELFDGGPSVTLSIGIPPAVTQGAGDLVHDAADAVRGLVGSVTGARPWE